MHSTIGRRALSPVVTVEVNTSVQESLALMSSREIGSLVVLSEGHPVGILTERDIVFAANWMLGQPDVTVEQVMNKEVATIDIGISLAEACIAFRDSSARHLVVVNRQGQLLGLFTQTELVKALDRKVFPEEMSVADLMSRRVWSTHPATSARYALSLMARHAISGVLVTDGQNPSGFFTERHVVHLVNSGQDLSECPVGNLSLSPVYEIAASEHPVRAISLMKKKSVRRLLVREDNQSLVGVLTKTDLSRSLDCGRVPEHLPALSVVLGGPAPANDHSNDSDPLV